MPIDLNLLEIEGKRQEYRDYIEEHRKNVKTVSRICWIKEQHYCLYHIVLSRWRKSVTKQCGLNPARYLCRVMLKKSAAYINSHRK